jgi:hypothetical protein
MRSRQGVGRIGISRSTVARRRNVKARRSFTPRAIERMTVASDVINESSASGMAMNIVYAVKQPSAANESETAPANSQRCTRVEELVSEPDRAVRRDASLAKESQRALERSMVRASVGLGRRAQRHDPPHRAKPARAEHHHRDADERAQPTRSEQNHPAATAIAPNTISAVADR